MRYCKYNAVSFLDCLAQRRFRSQSHRFHFGSVVEWIEGRDPGATFLQDADQIQGRGISSLFDIRSIANAQNADFGPLEGFATDSQAIRGELGYVSGHNVVDFSGV